MKACVDCIHFETDGPANRHGPWCARFAKVVGPETYSPVYGLQPRPVSAPDCKDARADGGQCGVVGRSWEPKPGSPAYGAWWDAKLRKAVEAKLKDVPIPAAKPWWKFW